MRLSLKHIGTIYIFILLLEDQIEALNVLESNFGNYYLVMIISFFFYVVKFMYIMNFVLMYIFMYVYH